MNIAPELYVIFAVNVLVAFMAGIVFSGIFQKTLFKTEKG